MKSHNHQQPYKYSRHYHYQKQEDLIYSKTNVKTNIMRFPGGSSTAKNLKNDIIIKLREKGYGWVDWTAQDGDGGALKSRDQAWNIFTKSINDNIEGLIKRNLAVGLPVLVSLDGSVGHMVWLEDYDQITDRYYINFGWGGFCDTWYKLDDINADGDRYYIDLICMDDAPETRLGIISGNTNITDNGIYTTAPSP